MTAILINFNDSVRVRLTQRGIDRYRDWTAEHGRRSDPPPQDHDGYRTFQLWDMMACFGPTISLGLSDLFEMDALLILPSMHYKSPTEVPDAKEAQAPPTAQEPG